METQRKLIVRGIIGGLLGVILSAGIAWAGPPFDPHTAEGGLPQCKADLAICITNLTQTQSNYGACLNDLGACTEELSTCEADRAACQQTVGVPRTGQIDSYGLGDDGAWAPQVGVMWPTPRFIDNNDGTVADNFSGLIWTKNANLFPQRNWLDSLASCNILASGAYDLRDGSRAGDWRLPNVRELLSLIDYSTLGPALPEGHPFMDVKAAYYWSSTTYALSPTYAWIVSLNSGSMTPLEEKSTSPPVYSVPYVWCVRGGY